MPLVISFCSDTITEANIALSDQITRHMGMVFPALLTALDVSDAIALSDHIRVTNKRRQAGLRMSKIMHIRTEMKLKELQQAEDNAQTPAAAGAPPEERLSAMLRHPLLFRLEQMAEHCVAVCVWHALQCLLIGAGVFLFVYVFVVFRHQVVECQRQIGAIAKCASPQHYFKQGLFGAASCAWDRVHTIDCSTGRLGAVAKNTWRLPNASGQYYAQMSALTLINLDSQLVENIPTAWGDIPPSSTGQASVTLSLQHCPRLHHFPYALCSAESAIKHLLLDSETPFSQALDWSRLPVNAANATRFSINQACQGAFRATLAFLNLSHNDFTCVGKMVKKGRWFWDSTQCDFDDVQTFQNISLLDLSHNNLSNIDKHTSKILYQVMMSTKGVSPHVLLEHNPLHGIWLPGLKSTQVVEWLDVAHTARNDIEFLDVRGCSLDSVSIQKVGDILLGSSIRHLGLVSVFQVQNIVCFGVCLVIEELIELLNLCNPLPLYVERFLFRMATTLGTKA